jgi:hypothetical protein
MKSALITLTLALVLASNAMAPASAENRPAQSLQPALPVEQLQEDLRVMRAALAESHVGLDWYIPRPELDRRFQAIADGLNRPLSVRDFHRQLLPVVAAIRHGHTTLELPVPWAGYRLKLNKDGRFLPLELRVLDERVYVLADLGEKDEVPAGSEIVAIDGRPVGQLLQQFRQHLSADGGSETYQAHQLGQAFQFAHLLDLLQGPAQRLRVDFLAPSALRPASRRLATQSPARMAERYRQRFGREIDSFGPPLQFELLPSRTARLTVSAFIDGQADFRAGLASAFKAIRAAGVEDLIIDVRGNAGGDGDLPPLLYSYLAHQPFRQASPTIVASASLSSLAYAEAASDVLKAFAATPLAFVTRQPDGTWVLKPEIDDERYREYPPQPDRFLGRLWVLVDGGAFSATNQFLDLVHQHHRKAGLPVRFVGEAPGGDSHLGRDSGGQANSRQRLSIPLLGFRQFFAAPAGAPAIPDDLVRPSLQDLLSRTDRELLFALQAIEASRRR